MTLPILVKLLNKINNLFKEIIEAESVIKNIPDPDKQNENSTK